MPGMMVLPVTSMRFAFAGIATSAPMAVIVLPSTTIVPFSMTPAVPLKGLTRGPRPERLALLSPAAVMIRAPTSAIVPSGASLFTVNPIGVPFASGSSGFSRPWSRNVNVRERSRAKSSGPIDQSTRRLSPDQWMLKPASREMRAVG